MGSPSAASSPAVLWELRGRVERKAVHTVTKFSCPRNGLEALGLLAPWSIHEILVVHGPWRVCAENPYGHRNDIWPPARGRLADRMITNQRSRARSAGTVGQRRWQDRVYQMQARRGEAKDRS